MNGRMVIFTVMYKGNMCRLTCCTLSKACHAIHSLYTFSVLGNVHTEVYIGLAAGVAVAIVLLISIIGVISFVKQRRWGKTTELQVLIEGDSSQGSYGTVVAGSNPLKGNYPSIQAKPGA